MQKTDSERQALEILEAMFTLQLKSVRQLLGEEDMPKRRRMSGKRHQSLVDQSVEILTEAGCPMHVREIVEQLQGKHGRITDRDAVSSALGKKVRQGVLFRQPAPATFDLLAREGKCEGGAE